MAARLVAAAVACAALAAGCSHRKPGACTVQCAGDSRCPEDSTCGADGYCHAAGDTSVCLPGQDLPDAGPPADAGVGQLDGDPCEGAANEISDQDRRDVFIPDDDVAGIDRTITFTGGCVTVATIEVRVEIRHEYRGDVEIRLTSPAGDTALVLDSSEDATPNIFETFEVDLAVGESADGDWVLNVRDVVADLVGTLEYWSIGINTPAP